LRERFAEESGRLLELIASQKEIERKREELKEKREYYAFRLKEIDSVAPQPGEDQELERELNILENAEKLLSLSSEAFTKLYDGEVSAYDLVSSALKEIEALAKIDPGFVPLLPDLEGALAGIRGSADTIRDYRHNIDLDPAKLEANRERLLAINRLKQKFGGSLEAVLEAREKFLTEIDLADNFAQHLSELNKEIAQAREACGKLALELSEKRRKNKGELSKQIVAKLAELGIKSGNFEVKVTQEEANEKDNHTVVCNGKNLKFNKDGADTVEFYISTNAGEEPKPLVKVASGGEISRVMLALKSVLAGMDRIPVLVFDEVDNGISGRIAQKVGGGFEVAFRVSSDNSNNASSADCGFFRIFHFSVVKIEERWRHFHTHQPGFQRPIK
jgi:ATPase involved in DNA repair